MSRLLAIDTQSMKEYRDLKDILSHVGQNKDYFLVNIPPSIEQQLLQFARSNEFSDMQKKMALELISRIKSNAIIKFPNDNSTQDFVKKVSNFYLKDPRLEVAIADMNEPKPFRSIDNVEWPGAKSLQLDPTDSYNESDLDRIWRYLEFHLITAKKIALVGSYNFIFDPNFSSPKKTNLHRLLFKFFNEFKRRGCRCEEFFIYAAPNEKEYSFIETQRKSITLFLNDLMRIHKIRFGIHYVVFNHRDIKKELHQRFLITSCAAINMGSEFSESKNLSVISPITDNDRIDTLQNKWLEEKWENKGHLIIRSS